MKKKTKTKKVSKKTIMKGEIKLIVPQFVNFTASYSHKFVPENFGIDGHRFAPFDFFQSYGSQVLIEEATSERLKEESDRLYRLAKADVENRIAELIKEIKVSLQTPVEDAMTAEELDGVSVFIKMLATGSSKDEINTKIVSAKEQLNERQLAFLRNVIKSL